MLLSNIRCTVEEITFQVVILVAESGERIEIPRQFLPDVAKGQELYIAGDDKPLASFDKQAKDIVNEIIADT